MSNNVEKATDGVSTLLEKLGDYLDSAQKVIVKYAPDVWDATLVIIRTRAIFEIVIWSIAIGLVIWGAKKSIAGLKANQKLSWVDRHEWPVILSVATGFLAFGCVIAVLTCGFETALAAFAPQYAVLYSLGVKVGIF